MTQKMPILRNDINAFIGKTVVDLPELFVTITIGMKPFVSSASLISERDTIESETFIRLNDLENRCDSHESLQSKSTIIEEGSKEKTQQIENKHLDNVQQPLTKDIVIRLCRYISIMLVKYTFIFYFELYILCKPAFPKL